MPSDRPEPAEVERVAVLGAGTIGAGWTALFLAYGMEVDIFDPSPEAETRVERYVETAWPSLETLGMVRESVRPRVRFHADPASAVANAQFVQESVPERIEVKHAIYREAEPAMAPDTVLATSASGLLVREMQEALQRPGRFLLAHPFNPPHLIPLVEILGNEATDEDAVDWAIRFFEHCGKRTIRLRKEVPGHVANRLQAALWREAIHLVVEGVASVEDVDKAVVHGPGLRWAVMGPHMLFNLGSGGQGLEVFCERYRDSFDRWWDSLGTPRLSTEIAAALAEGVKEEEAGRAFQDLSAERDEKLVAILRQLREIEAPRGGG